MKLIHNDRRVSENRVRDAHVPFENLRAHAENGRCRVSVSRIREYSICNPKFRPRGKRFFGEINTARDEREGERSPRRV